MAIRVFISSKMAELQDERAALAFQIAHLPGFEVIVAEKWGALSASVQHLYLGGVQRSHIYLGLFGRVYSQATHAEYEEACRNPYRQKLIYLKRGARSIDEPLRALIATFEERHKPYQFRDLWDLQQQVLTDLDTAVVEMLNQHLQLGQSAPIAQSDGVVSVLQQAWQRKQLHLRDLYEEDTELSTAFFEELRAGISRSRNQLPPHR